METEKDSENNSAPDGTAKTNKDSNKEDLEERYNKLKGFALKLKKKVNDLSEELKTSEAEKIKAVTEREEIQKKVSQISDNAKKLQTIQLEYDRLQDALEEQKSENRKITKNLETLVLENTTLKQCQYEQRDNVAHVNSDLENRTKELTELKAIFKKNQSLIKKLEEEKRAEVMIREQREKDYEDMKNQLEAEIQAHRTTKGQLDTARQERASNNVLFLEVDNYERSIEDLKSKLADESERCRALESTIEEQRQLLSTSESQLAELRDTCFAKTNQLTTLGEKNESLKSELCDLRQEIVQMTKEKETLLDAMETIKSNSDKLSKESAAHTAERSKLLSEIENQSKNHVQQVEILKFDISRLTDALQHSNNEIESLRAEFEGYKLRAQSVLRNKQSQNKESGLNGRSISEIEAELNHLRSHSSQLQEKLKSSDGEIKSLTTDLSLVREERDSVRDSARDLGKKLSALSQDYSTLREQYRMQLSVVDRIRDEFETKEESLKTNYEMQISTLEQRYQLEIEKLRSDLSKLSSKTVDKSSEFRHDGDSNVSRNDMHLLEREDGEGSESVDSYTIGGSSAEKQRRPSLMPLDELLNSSDDFSKSSGPPLPSKVDRQELEISERRVKHLTVLLADAERDVAKLNQLNQMLKEDIRRQQRSVEREHHANNFEYLKNVVMKFVTLRNGDERSRLIPVLNTILKLSPEETHQLNQVAGVSGRGWLPSLPIPGWSHD
ncbi:GRIP and coiled-coil domain-containing protein 2 [Diachasma alloeum]|uniref:GRIP and coiled-coil domain-containing protein 2 n=1 Tax=Diachasma alloeum TaxID=454923 RepID=UPI00073829BD|nr:GRIP and coiled-coil domain-containing protein 2 [Diachasma alloeum]XP_015111847.1 GRIP and coiled-coil domain-containing protein 2 [Diachasma alloeum]